MGQFKGTSAVVGASGELSMLRHELANVVGGLAGMTELLKSSPLEPEQLHWLEAIEESAAQAHFLLATSCSGRLEDPASNRSVRPIDGPRLLEQAVMAHTPAVLKANGRLLLELSTDLPIYWRVEPRPLRQVLDNVLTNAAKFAPGTDILFSAQSRGDAVMLSVEDGGKGVPPDQHERIFKVGERGARGTEAPGTGLGLALCRSLLGGMNGSIRCGDAAGGGARFEIVLHCASVKKQPTPPAFAALSNLHCCLDLEACFERIVGQMLDRLGVSYSVGSASRPRTEGHLVLSISLRKEACLPRHGNLVLETLGDADGGTRLQVPPPLLQSTLHRALLRQVLAWRWAINSASEGPG